VLQATGTLVEVKARKSYQNREGVEVTPYELFIYSGGRMAERYDVGRELNVAEVEALVGRTVVCDILARERFDRIANRVLRDLIATTCREHAHLAVVENVA
jgi:hypothetical protein